MCDGGASSSEDNSEDEGPRGDTLRTVELSFVVFPSLKKGAAEQEQLQQQLLQGGYVPWELQAPPWRRLAKWVRRKYMVALLARGKPAVLVIQTNYAPEHPNRAHTRSKELLGWAAKELSVVGEVRLVLRGQVRGVGFTMGEQVAANEELEAADGVRAFLTEMGENEQTVVAVIACFKDAGFEPPSWLPQLEGLRDEGTSMEEEWDDEEWDEEDEKEAGEEVEAGEAEEADDAGELEESEETGDTEAPEEVEDAEESAGPVSSVLQEFIEGVKVAAGITAGQVDAMTMAAAEGDGAEPEPEPELEPQPQPQPETSTEVEVVDEAAIAEVRRQLEERATQAARVMDEERGMGLIIREELQAILQRCADTDTQSVSHRGIEAVDIGDVKQGERAAAWEQLLRTPPRSQPQADPTLEGGPEQPPSPPPGLSAKEKKKWQKRQDKLALA